MISNNLSNSITIRYQILKANITNLLISYEGNIHTKEILNRKISEGPNVGEIDELR